MNPTEQINEWIREHGSARDALNVALARLDAANRIIEALLKERELFVGLYDAADDALYTPGKGYTGAIQQEHVEALAARFFEVCRSETPDVATLLAGESEGRSER